MILKPKVWIHLWQRKLCILNLDKNMFKMAMNFKMFWAKINKQSFELPRFPHPPKKKILHHNNYLSSFHQKSSNHPFPQMSGLYNPVHCMHFHFWNVSNDLLNLNLWYLLTGERSRLKQNRSFKKIFKWYPPKKKKQSTWKDTIRHSKKVSSIPTINFHVRTVSFLEISSWEVDSSHTPKEIKRKASTRRSWGWNCILL